MGSLFVVFLEGFGHRLHFGNVAHALDEEDCGQEHSHFDGHRQIDNHREEERHQHHDHVALGGLEHLDKAPVAAHVESHLEKHGSKGRHGNHLGVLAKHQHNKQEHHRMHQARNRAYRTVTDVCSRTGNSARCRNTAKDGRQDVGDTLAEKFRVGAVLGRGHTVGHHGTEQGLDGAQHGDGQGRLEHLLHHLEANVGQMGHREPAGDMVFHADGHHAVTVHRVVPAQHLHKDRGHHDGHQGTRNLRRNFRPQDTYSQSN